MARQTTSADSAHVESPSNASLVHLRICPVCMALVICETDNLPEKADITSEARVAALDQLREIYNLLELCKARRKRKNKGDFERWVSG